MFDARLLSVFREVATRGSFSEAATALSFTQPAVSQQIARLERELGTRLLARNARGVTPTPAGEVLLRHAETMLAQLREAEAEVQAVAGVERPRLRVGAFASAAASIMPPALAARRAGGGRPVDRGGVKGRAAAVRGPLVLGDLRRSGGLRQRGDRLAAADLD